MNKPVGAGVSSACFFPLETADSVKILSEWHIPNIEIFFNSFQELKDGYLERLSALCREAGTQVVSIHPFTSNSESLYFFTSYPGRLQDGLMIYRPFLRAAQKLGARVLVFHGATLQNRMDIPQSAANLRVLDRVAREEYGVTVAYENVVRCRGKDPDYFVQLREYYPELRFVLDVKQALRSGHHPLEYVEELGDSIIHVHISDSSPQQDCLPVGQGEMDILARRAFREQCCRNCIAKATASKARCWKATAGCSARSMWCGSGRHYLTKFDKLLWKMLDFLIKV